MKITFIAHASILVEVGGIKIISDPWWKGPCFGAQWWNFPKPFLSAVDIDNIDYVYISHGHHDHFHPGTLKTFNKKTKVLASKNINLAPPIRDLGFEVIEIADNERHALTDKVACRVMETYEQDTLMVIEGDGQICINLNDALHAAPSVVQEKFIAELNRLYPKIDYIFCGYGVASHFPNCYVIPHKAREKTAAMRQSHFNHQWTNIIGRLSPRFGFPFAADVAFFEDDLFWVNEPVHNSERPTAVFQQKYPHSETQIFDIRPGFTIENGKVLNQALREPVSSEKLKREYEQEIERANRYGSAEDEVVSEVRDLLEQNIKQHQNYFAAYAGDYHFLIRFRNTDSAIDITKNDGDIALSIVKGEIKDRSTYDVIMTTRLAYLKWSLTTDYGHEILFVGSGVIFEYTGRTQIDTNVHRELIMMVKKHLSPPTRPVINRNVKWHVKQLVKKLLGYRTQDLYDLKTWTIFNN